MELRIDQPSSLEGADWYIFGKCPEDTTSFFEQFANAYKPQFEDYGEGELLDEIKEAFSVYTLQIIADDIDMALGDITQTN